MIKVGDNYINPLEIAALRTLYEKGGYGQPYANGVIIILKNGERIEVERVTIEKVSKMIIEAQPEREGE